jgi:hypothetical protein
LAEVEVTDMKQAPVADSTSAVADGLAAVYLLAGLAWTVIEPWLTIHSGPMSGPFQAIHGPALIGRQILELPHSGWELLPRTWLLTVSVTVTSFAEVCATGYLFIPVLTAFRRRREQTSTRSS